MHGQSGGARASSDINHPNQRIAGLLTEGLDISKRIRSGVAYQ